MYQSRERHWILIKWLTVHFLRAWWSVASHFQWHNIFVQFAGKKRRANHCTNDKRTREWKKKKHRRNEERRNRTNTCNVNCCYGQQQPNGHGPSLGVRCFVVMKCIFHYCLSIFNYISNYFMRKQWNQTDTDIIRIVRTCAGCMGITFTAPGYHISKTFSHWCSSMMTAHDGQRFASLLNLNVAVTPCHSILFQLRIFEKMAPMCATLSSIACSIDELLNLLTFNMVQVCLGDDMSCHSCTADVTRKCEDYRSNKHKQRIFKTVNCIPKILNSNSKALCSVLTLSLDESIDIRYNENTFHPIACNILLFHFIYNGMASAHFTKAIFSFYFIISNRSEVNVIYWSELCIAEWQNITYKAQTWRCSKRRRCDFSCSSAEISVKYNDHAMNDTWTHRLIDSAKRKYALFVRRERLHFAPIEHYNQRNDKRVQCLRMLSITFVW